MNIFTPKMIQWLSKNVPGKSFEDITPLFNCRFRTNLTITQIRSVCKYRGIKNGRIGRRKGRLKIGEERIFNRRVNILFVKVSEKRLKRLHSNASREGGWIQKHWLIWEEAFGTIPKRHIVIFADGNKRNFDIKNLLLVSYREHYYMAKNYLYSNDPELTKTNLLITRQRLSIIDCMKKLTGDKSNISTDYKFRRYKILKEARIGS